MSLSLGALTHHQHDHRILGSNSSHGLSVSFALSLSLIPLYSVCACLWLLMERGGLRDFKVVSRDDGDSSFFTTAAKPQGTPRGIREREGRAVRNVEHARRRRRSFSQKSAKWGPSEVRSDRVSRTNGIFILSHTINLEYGRNRNLPLTSEWKSWYLANHCVFYCAIYLYESIERAVLKKIFCV